jgi:hypothetical protein
MKKCAIIVENRDLPNMADIISSHMDYLPGWNLKHIKDVNISNGGDYNKLLTDYEFWSNLHFDKILFFQHDSGILRTFDDDFLDYSYVGSPWKADAPWNTKDRRGGNGGISVRDVKEHRKLLSHKHWTPNQGNEDVFYSHNLPNVAPYEICVKFGVETEFKLGTFCHHAIDKHLTSEQCNHILNQYEL